MEEKGWKIPSSCNVLNAQPKALHYHREKRYHTWGIDVPYGLTFIVWHDFKAWRFFREVASYQILGGRQMGENHWLAWRANQWLLDFHPATGLVLGPLKRFCSQAEPFKSPQPDLVNCFRNIRETRALSSSLKCCRLQRRQDTLKNSGYKTWFCVC